MRVIEHHGKRNQPAGGMIVHKPPYSVNDFGYTSHSGGAGTVAWLEEKGFRRIMAVQNLAKTGDLEPHLRQAAGEYRKQDKKLAAMLEECADMWATEKAAPPEIDETKDERIARLTAEGMSASLAPVLQGIANVRDAPVATNDT